MGTKKLGIYQIQGSDGHIYDSMFQASNNEEAVGIINQSAQRIRTNSKLTGKARFFLSKNNTPPKRIRWKYITI